MSKRSEFSKYPICDTDVWVNLCHAEIESQFFNIYEKVHFSFAVEKEILRWTSNPTYSYISEKFNSAVSNGNAIVINESDLTDEDKKYISQILSEDFGIMDCFKRAFNGFKNAGECISGVIADHFEIPFMSCNDGLFNGGRGSKLLPDLCIKNWDKTLDSIVTNELEKRRIVNIVREKNENMRQNKLKYEKEPISRRAIQAFMVEFNSKNL
ncbi:MAG: hypothetical protein RSA01_00425 [Clostridium sp.]|uniref:hypothetical protein n=1 Tax=Clostridium sp. TaxID=1506 RepID=UPI002FC9FAB1